MTLLQQAILAGRVTAIICSDQSALFTCDLEAKTPFLLDVYCLPVSVSFEFIFRCNVESLVLSAPRGSNKAIMSCAYAHEQHY